MKETNSLSHLQLSRWFAVVVCLFLLIIAVTPVAIDSAKAKKSDALSANALGRAPVSSSVVQNPSSVGQWSAVETLSTVPVHISLLPDGRLLYWGRDKDTDKWDIGNTCQTYTYHPTTKVKETLSSKPLTNLFCSGHSFLPDGRLLVTGGHFRNNSVPSQEGNGERDVNIFDYTTNTWTTFADAMPKGRWYPSHVTLANGETVIISGYYRDASGVLAVNDKPDLFTSVNTIRSFTASSTIPVYPFLHLAPNGKVFVAGPGPAASQFFDPTANGGNGLFSVVTTRPSDHVNGSSVITDPVLGKILIVGGKQEIGGALDATVEQMDLSNPGLYWETNSFITYARKFHTATILPDGKVLVSDGTWCSGSNNVSCGALTQPELWDPALNTWWVMAARPSGIPRAYHSVAVLLPDARVLVGGGGLPAAGGEIVPNNPPPGNTTCLDGSQASTNIHCRIFGHKDVEIFSPPYLFTSSGTLATRPRIITSPNTIARGQTFAVGKNSGAAGVVGSVVFIRLPSVTHGFNFDQRRIPVNFQVVSSTSINVTVPSDGRVCPPGHYMMFLINSSGVPSIAKIIRVT